MRVHVAEAHIYHENLAAQGNAVSNSPIVPLREIAVDARGKRWWCSFPDAIQLLKKSNFV
jgi:hypothetical protein